MKTRIWVDDNTILVEGDITGMIERPRGNNVEVAVSDGSLLRFVQNGTTWNFEVMVEGDRLTSTCVYPFVFRDGINWVAVAGGFLKR